MTRRSETPENPQLTNKDWAANVDVTSSFYGDYVAYGERNGVATIPLFLVEDTEEPRNSLWYYLDRTNPTIANDRLGWCSPDPTLQDTINNMVDLDRTVKPLVIAHVTTKPDDADIIAALNAVFES